MTPKASQQSIPGSFRDPEGFLFFQGGKVFRQVNLAGEENYCLLMSSGLYEELSKARLLISHKEVSFRPQDHPRAYRLLEPDQIPFISYPYEWCFEQLKDAALLTLEIQQKAIEADLSLKDASAYNIQFLDGKPIFIDTLSFEKCRAGEPWSAYRQFCQHFLAPLALMAYADIRLVQLMKNYIDGVPLDLASRLLPVRSRLNLALLWHLHIHSKMQGQYGGKKVKKEQPRVSKMALLGLVDNLKGAIQKLVLKTQKTEWGDYYNDTNYQEASFEEKKKHVGQMIDQVQPLNVWDLGANRGVFSRLASERGAYTVAFDIDPEAVQNNYREIKKNHETKLLPLLLDLTNPSPAIGWANAERASLHERKPPELVLALALIHHLAIANNVPLEKIAEYLSKLSKHVILEFVPKEDSQVQRLLANREDIFPQYTSEGFESAFRRFFSIKTQKSIAGTKRALYLLERI